MASNQVTSGKATAGTFAAKNDLTAGDDVTAADDITATDDVSGEDLIASDDATVGDDLAVTDQITGADLNATDDLAIADDAVVTDDISAGGSIKSSSATEGIGYATGSGGAVTQLTSKATGVTLNKSNGAITLHAEALAADAIASFVFTNSAIDADDLLVLNHVSGGTPGKYSLNARCGSGSATIDVTNISAGSLSEAIVIQFAVVKGVQA